MIYRCTASCLLAGVLLLEGCASPRPSRTATSPPSANLASPNASSAPSVRLPGPGVRQAQSAFPVMPQAWREEAENWLGTPYRLGGLTRGGVDCSGLVFQIYRLVAGVTLPRTSKEQLMKGLPVRPNDLKPGDLLFFYGSENTAVNHVGIYLGRRQFVHASQNKGVIMSSMREPYYASHFYGAKRILP